MSGKTIAEKILSVKSGLDARAGDVVVAQVDLVLGTDASTPMAIDYFERMGGRALFDPGRVVFALDHYSPPSSPSTIGFHERIRTFASAHSAAVHEVGDGIGFQIATERGRVLPGDLVVGADSHTVTCGALNAFATGVGSSDLAAALITGRVWLEVPGTIKVVLTGTLARGVGAKDVALALVGEVGSEGASGQALEFLGPGLASLDLEDRLVIANMSVEMGAMAGIFPGDEAIATYLKEGPSARREAVVADGNAPYSREIVIDVSTVTPRVALPHAPDNVVSIEDAVGRPVQMVFIGTCNGGRVPDVHEVLDILERAGGRIAPGVQLVVTPASGEVHRALVADGSIAKLEAMGAIVTTAGCGACCGTSGVIPTDGMTVISTANRNFKARMGNPTASIHLASPATCAASAITGRITDPRTLGD